MNNIIKISKTIELDYGHTLPNHYSFCSQIHGHRAKVIATVEGNICTESSNSSQGMVLDFSFLKKIMMDKIHLVLDHGFAVWKDDKEDLEYIKNRNKKYLVTDLPPTAEYLAKWAFEQLEPEIPTNLRLVSLDWYETPSSVAVYSNPNL